MTDVPVIDWTAPTPDQVAQLLRARTKDSTGRELGAWTDDTRPTLTEVEGIIEQAVAQLAATVSSSIPDTCKNGASSTAALLAAMLVELSYFPEQVRTDRSAYVEYKNLYDENVLALRKCVDTGGATAGGEGFTYHSLPIVPATSALYAARAAGWPSWWWSTLGPWGDLPGEHWPEPENPANWPDPFNPPTTAPVGDEPASGTTL